MGMHCIFLQFFMIGNYFKSLSGKLQFSSVQSFNHVLLFVTHGLQHTKLPCPSLALRAYANSCLLSLWSPPTISSSVVPFSFCPQSFPESGSFPMIRLITSGGQSIGASASVLLMNIQGWFLFRLTGLFSLHPRDSWESSPTLQFQSINSSALSLLCGPTHIHTWLLGKTTTTNTALTKWTFVGKVMSLLFNTLSLSWFSFQGARILISWLQPLSPVIVEPKMIKSVTVAMFPICLPWSDGT